MDLRIAVANVSLKGTVLVLENLVEQPNDGSVVTLPAISCVLECDVDVRDNVVRNRVKHTYRMIT